MMEINAYETSIGEYIQIAANDIFVVKLLLVLLIVLVVGTIVKLASYHRKQTALVRYQLALEIGRTWLGAWLDKNITKPMLVEKDNQTIRNTIEQYWKNMFAPYGIEFVGTPLNTNPKYRILCFHLRLNRPYTRFSLPKLPELPDWVNWRLEISEDAITIGAYQQTTIWNHAEYRGANMFEYRLNSEHCYIRPNNRYAVELVLALAKTCAAIDHELVNCPGGVWDGTISIKPFGEKQIF